MVASSEDREELVKKARALIDAATKGAFAKTTARTLPVDFVRSFSQAYAALRSVGVAVLAQQAKILEMDQDAVEHLLHGGVSVRGIVMVASACPPRVECSVDWTAPLATKEMKETKRSMKAAQAKIVNKVRAGAEDGSGGGASPTNHKELQILMTRQMTHYKATVEAAEADEAATCARLMKLVADLNPKYDLCVCVVVCCAWASIFPLSIQGEKRLCLMIL